MFALFQIPSPLRILLESGVRLKTGSCSFSLDAQKREDGGRSIRDLIGAAALGWRDKDQDGKAKGHRPQ
jgi:hypothetical protein